MSDWKIKASPVWAPPRLWLCGSEVLLQDLKKEFKELALADAAPQIFKCLAVLKYVLTADLSGIHLCVDS